MKLTETDKQAATAVISAVKRSDRNAFDSTFDSTVERYGGLARLLWAVGEEACR